MKIKLPAEIDVACTVLLLAALAVVNASRAWTQSITYDEAVTYDAFVVGPMTNAFTGYNANNHVLFTVLAKITTRVFGPSEFGLRFPSVAAGGLYFAEIFLLGRLLFGRGVICSLAVAALALNPFVLDFLSAARGYGLALALFLVALHRIAMILVRRTPSETTAENRRWVVASLALAGSVSANLAFLFPAVALGLVALAIGACEAPGGSGRTRVMHVGRTALRLFGPAILIVVPLLAVPLSRAEREHFTYGASRLSETMTSLVDVSVRHHPLRWPFDLLATTLGKVEATVLIPLTLIVMLATAGIVATRAVRERRMSGLTAADGMLLLLTGTLLLTLAEVMTTHLLWDVPYPLDRTGLYFIPMFILATALLAQTAEVWSRWSPAVRRFSLVLLAVLIAQSVAQFNVTQYAMWRFDAGTRTLYEITARWPDMDRNTPVRIAATSLLRPSLEYYRTVDANSRVSSVSDGLQDIRANDFEFAIVFDRIWGDGDSVRDATNLVCVHPVSGAMLFVNRASRAARGLGLVRDGSPPRSDCESILSGLRGSRF